MLRSAWAKHFLAALAANPVSGALLRPLLRGQASIFLAHRLAEHANALDEVSLNSIRESLRVLRRAGAKFVSVRELFERSARGLQPEPGSVAFTIDDGYWDQGVMAERGFLENGCPITMFVVSGLVDGTLWPWDDHVSYAITQTRRSKLHCPVDGRDFALDSAESRRHATAHVQRLCKSKQWQEAKDILEALWSDLDVQPPKQAPPGYRPLDWTEARRLEAVGVDFAPHSVSHRITSQLTDLEAHDEIRTSWQRLCVELVRPVPVYAWPTGRAGDYTPRDQRYAFEVGLIGAVAVEDGYADFGRKQGGAGPFGVKRFALSSSSIENLQYGTALERLKQIVRRAE